MASFNTLQETSSNSEMILEEPSILRCRRCRRCVADSTSLFIASKELMTTCSVWHMDIDNLPDWILSVVNEVHWTVGKLNCWNCGARLGGFNFINYPKCPCGHDTTVHLSKSRVDQGIKHVVHVSHPDRVSGCVERLENLIEIQKVLEGLLDIDRVQSIADIPAVTQNLSMRIEESHLDDEPNFPPFRHVGEQRSVTVDTMEPGQGSQSHGSVYADDNEVYGIQEHLTIEPLRYLENTEHSFTHLPDRRTALETHEQQVIEDITPGTTEHPLLQAASGPVKLTKREKNHLKSLRRKQRKKERWFRSQLETKQCTKLNQTASNDEKKEDYTCPVCLDVYYNPYMCQPCSHVFCEPCLRTLAKGRASSTPCPLCRTIITNVLFQRELYEATTTCFPEEFQSQKEVFQKTNYSKWPLPSCPNRFFRILGLQRQRDPGERWQISLIFLLYSLLQAPLLLDSERPFVSCCWILLACIGVCAFCYMLTW